MASAHQARPSGPERSTHRRLGLRDTVSALSFLEFYRGLS